MHRPPYRSLEERLLYNSVFDPDTGCRIWLGKIHVKGYGQITLRTDKCYPVSMYAHRIMWEQVNGPIPEGMTLDHTCCNKACIEPTHMELVTAAENTRRRNQREFEQQRMEELGYAEI